MSGFFGLMFGLVGSLMDKSIIQGFAKLRVLTPCDFQRMDELVQDLTNALEESTGNSRGKQRKRRGRRLRSLKLSLIPSRSLTPPDAFQMPSEESISSTDEIKPSKDTSRLDHQSDSDGVSSSSCLAITNYIQRLTTFPVGHFVESDSVNENFSPVRPHRRRVVDVNHLICYPRNEENINQFAMS